MVDISLDMQVMHQLFSTSRGKHSLLDAFPHPVWVWNRELVCLYANPSARTELLLNEGEGKAASRDEWVRVGWKRWVELALKKRSPLSAQGLLPGTGGEKIELNIHPLIGPGLDWEEACLVFPLNPKRTCRSNCREYELSEELASERRVREQAETELNETNQYYNRLISSAPVAIAIYSGGRFLFSNRAHTKLMGGTSSADLVGRPVLEVIDPDYHACFEERHRMILDKKANAPLASYCCRRLDGSVIYVETIAIPLRYQGKEAFMGIAVDVTESKRAQEKLEMQQQQLIQADKLASLGTVASGVAHEISNPNNFIMLNASVLSRIWHDLQHILDGLGTTGQTPSIGRMNYAEVKERVPLLCSGILEGSKRIESIVKGLKNYARPSEFGVKEDVDVNAMVDASVKLISVMIRKSTKKFTVRKGRKIPAIRGDFQRLEQVMVNLIMNACQALPDPDKTVRVTTSFKRSEGSVRIRVDDEGEGIPEENLGRILDPFFTTKRDVGGTGLGLPISNRIISDHNGTMYFTSKAGKGTSVTIELPVIPCDRL